MNKFEKLIEYIINDEDQKARELFHDIVVEKSRDIYESIMDEESMEETVGGAQVEDMVDEIGHDESHAMEADEEGEEFDVDGEDGLGDEEPADFGGEEEFGGDAEEDKIMNIDAKLDELLAKFDEIMGDEGHDEIGHEEPAMDMGHEEEVGAEEPEQFAEAAGSGKSGNPFAKKGSAQSGKSGSGTSGSGTSAKSGKSGKSSSSELMREYVDRIGDIYGGEGDAAEGTTVGTGTGSPKKVAVNTKPASVGPGNDFGGTPVLSKGGVQAQDGTSPTKASNEYTKGESQLKSGNVNVPGGKAGTPKSTGDSYEKGGDSQGDATGKMAGTGKNTPASGDSFVKSTVVPNAGKK
jgi:hypothetical protein